MSCSFISESIKILVNTGGYDKDANTAISYRSALQNPDISRVQLAAMLRRKVDAVRRRKDGKSFWSSFVANQIAKHANANTGS